MKTYYISINLLKSDNPYFDYSKTFDELESEGYDLHPSEKIEKDEIEDKYLEIQIDVEDYETDELDTYIDKRDYLQCVVV